MGDDGGSPAGAHQDKLPFFRQSQILERGLDIPGLLIHIEQRSAPVHTAAVFLSGFEVVTLDAFVDYVEKVAKAFRDGAPSGNEHHRPPSVGNGGMMMKAADFSVIYRNVSFRRMRRVEKGDVLIPAFQANHFLNFLKLVIGEGQNIFIRSHKSCPGSSDSKVVGLYTAYRRD